VSRLNELNNPNDYYQYNIKTPPYNEQWRKEKAEKAAKAALGKTASESSR